MKHKLPAIIDKHGRLVFACSGARTRSEAWQLWLGWPDESEIEAKRVQGYRAVMADLSFHG